MQYTNSQIKALIRECIESPETGYSKVEALIHEWVIGDNAERDREVLCYWLLDGLTYEAITERYMLAHPTLSLSEATVKRIINNRSPKLFEHL